MELIEHLRMLESRYLRGEGGNNVYSEAADTIEQLQADKAELVELLRSVVSGRQYDNSNLARFIAKHTGSK